MKQNPEPGMQTTLEDGATDADVGLDVAKVELDTPDLTEVETKLEDDVSIGVPVKVDDVKYVRLEDCRLVDDLS